MEKTEEELYNQISQLTQKKTNCWLKRKNLEEKIEKKKIKTKQEIEQYTKSAWEKYDTDIEKDSEQIDELTKEISSFNEQIMKQEDLYYQYRIKKLIENDTKLSKFLKQPDQRILTIPFRDIYFFTSTGKRLKLKSFFSELRKNQNNEQYTAEELKAICQKIIQVYPQSSFHFYRISSNPLCIIPYTIQGFVTTFAEYFIINSYGTTKKYFGSFPLEGQFYYEQSERIYSHRLGCYNIYIDIELTLKMLECNQSRE